MEADALDVVEDVEEVGLDGVRVRCLAQDLQQGGVGDEEEPREQQALLLQVAARQCNQPTDQNLILWLYCMSLTIVVAAHLASTQIELVPKHSLHHCTKDISII